MQEGADCQPRNQRDEKERSHQDSTGRKLPITRNGHEKRSLRTEKQKAHGTGRPVGPSTTACDVTLELVLSNACLANDS